mgnify:CR=1 FL=1
MSNEKYEKGLQIRTQVLGEDYVNRSIQNADAFTQPLQQLVTEYCWGHVWGREGLSLKERSMINLAMISALNRPHELKLHIRGALRNGLSREQIREILLQVGIYCGVPAAVDSFRLAREAFAHLSAIGAQTEADGQRMTDLGARYVMITGNIKFDIAPPAPMQVLAADFRNRFGPQREILLAASTREGEEDPLLEAFARMCPPEVLLVLVPRHPDRFDEVAKLVKRAGLKLQKRSKGVPVMADTRVWLGDSMGEMHAYYGAADVAIIGGSWARLGGQNPIEASAVGCPVIVGQHTFNFKAVCEQAIEVGAAVRADDIDDALQVALEIIADPIRRKAMSEAGSLFAHSHRGATGRTKDLITPLLRTARPRRPGER